MAAKGAAGAGAGVTYLVSSRSVLLPTSTNGGLQNKKNAKRRREVEGGRAARTLAAHQRGRRTLWRAPGKPRVQSGCTGESSGSRVRALTICPC